jgi:hypothetical protein
MKLSTKSGYISVNISMMSPIIKSLKKYLYNKKPHTLPGLARCGAILVVWERPLWLRR